MHISDGQRIDRYLVLRVLGDPGESDLEARTLLALDTATGEDVVLSVATGSQREMLEFQRNLQKARIHTSPGLPPLLSGGVDGMLAFLSSARIPGVELFAIRRDGPLPAELATDLFWILTQALASLHGNQLCHGDIHPRNVRLSPEGEAYLVGFVPAPFQRPDRRPDPDRETRRYASPEVLEGADPNARADLFSLGLVIMETLAGRPVLPRADVARTLRAQKAVQSNLNRMLKVLENVPAGLQDVLHGLLDVDPSNRPRDATEVMGQLRAALPLAGDLTRLQDGLKSRLRLAAQRVQRATIQVVATSLSKQTPLAASSYLSEAAVLLPVAGDRYKDRLLSQLRRVFWRGLAPVQGDPDQGAALFLQLHLTAAGLGAKDLAELTLARFGLELKEGSQLRALLSGDLPEPPETAAKYIEGIRTNPADEDLLLGLAAATPDFRPTTTSSSARIKAQLLERHGLYRHALYQVSRDVLADKGLHEVLDDIVRLAELSRGLGPAEPSIGEELVLDAFLPLETKAPARSLYELHLSDSKPPGPESRPPRRDEFIQPSIGSSEAEARARQLFTQGQLLVFQGRLGEAAEVFNELMRMGVLEEELFYAAVCSEVRKLLWKALVRRSGKTPPYETLWRIWELAQLLDLRTLLPLCENLLLSALPPSERGTVLSRLVEESPRSLPLLQAAATYAQEQGDNDTWAKHLLQASWQLMEEGDLLEASKLVMAAKTASDSPEVSKALKALFQVGREISEVAQTFRKRIEDASNAGDNMLMLQICDDFLLEHPSFLPAHQRALEIAQDLSLSGRLAEELLEMAKRALRREDHGAARALLRDVLEAEYENDEALLYLASLAPPMEDPPDDVDVLRITLLRNEGLYPAATYLALRALKGGQQDERFHHLLIELCNESGDDPSPHFLGAGLLALERKDLGEARSLLTAAIQSAADRDVIVAMLADTPGIEGVFNPAELMRMGDVNLGP